MTQKRKATISDSFVNRPSFMDRVRRALGTDQADTEEPEVDERSAAERKRDERKKLEAERLRRFKEHNYRADNT